MFFLRGTLSSLNLLWLFTTNPALNKENIATYQGDVKADLLATQRAWEIVSRENLLHQFAPAFYFAELSNGQHDTPINLEDPSIMARYDLCYVNGLTGRQTCFGKLTPALLAKQESELRIEYGLSDIENFVLEPNIAAFERDDAWNSRLSQQERGQPAVSAYVKGYRDQDYFDIVYYLIYPFNGAQRIELEGWLGVEGKESAIAHVEGIAQHNGDAEALTIRVSPGKLGYELVGASFHPHGGCFTGLYHTWEKTDRVVGYVMAGSHAIWPSPAVDGGIPLSYNVRGFDRILSLGEYRFWPVDYGRFVEEPLMPPDYLLHDVTPNFVETLAQSVGEVVVTTKQSKENKKLFSSHGFALGFNTHAVIGQVVHEAGDRYLTDSLAGNPVVELVQHVKMTYPGGAPVQVLYQPKLQSAPIIVSQDMPVAVLRALAGVAPEDSTSSQWFEIQVMTERLLANVIANKRVDQREIDQLFQTCLEMSIPVSMRFGDAYIEDWNTLILHDFEEDKSALTVEVWQRGQCLSSFSLGELIYVNVSNATEAGYCRFGSGV